MAALVVDTDVFSFIFKADTRAGLYWPHLSGATLHLSFTTVAELYRWAVKNKWGNARVASLRAAMQHYVILGYDDRLAWHWAEIMSIPGAPMGSGDAWIAATALRHALPLITHNRKHFERIPGLNVISEA